ncbi:tyrosine-type recombinase/integrase [Pelotomaculum propionicicum]|uniref:tyrosine-type recombinase/integrase n=1 Tax=Pelotomaculum propionicicum TaxID=258475 RepID=UPI003B7CEC5D
MNGYVKKRGKSDDKWTVVVDFGRDPVTRKRKQKWTTVTGSKEDADKELIKQLHEINTGNYIEPSKMSLKEFLKYWLKMYAKTHCRKNTYDSYEIFIEKHIIPELGHIALAKLTPSQVEELLVNKANSGRADGKEGGLSQRSVKYIYSILHMALAYAVRKDMILKNPVEKVETPELTKKAVHAWTLEEAKKFLLVAEGSRFYTLFTLALSTGMRRGELLGLRWQDIDMRDNLGIINIRNGLSKQRTLEVTKTENSQRAVVISCLMVELLKEHGLKQLEEQLKMGDEYQHNGLVFCSTIGTPLNAENVVKRHFYPLVKKAEIKWITFHGLRHCYATLALAADASLKVVQQRLGHASIKTTGDIYSHPEIYAQTRVVNVVDEQLLGKKIPGLEAR